MELASSGIAQAFEGGLLIGAASAVLILFNGRVAGISGIFANVLEGRVGPRGVNLLFLIGLIAPAFLLGVGPVQFSSGLPLLAVAGLLVGAGTQLGSGCTSGHGVCGLANLSPRSLVAVMIFMATAGLTVWLVRHGEVL